MFSALSCLQRDPFCRECSSFVRCIEAIKDEFISLEKAINKNGALPEEMRCILSNMYAALADLIRTQSKDKRRIKEKYHEDDHTIIQGS